MLGESHDEAQMRNEVWWTWMPPVLALSLVTFTEVFSPGYWAGRRGRGLICGDGVWDWGMWGPGWQARFHLCLRARLRSEPHMLSYRATLPIPLVVVRCVSAWLHHHRRAHNQRRYQRAGTCWTQAVMFLRWLIDATPVHRLARDHGISQATAYRYLHEAIDVVADRAPTLEDVIADQLDTGAPFVALDGTLIHTNRCRTPSTSGNDAWYSGKHHAHGGNIQVLTDTTGFPIWTSPVEPGNTHDITAARTHALPLLYPAAANGLPTLADKGYTGAGIGIHTPFKGTNLDHQNRCYNRLQRALRAPAERANAILKGYRALRHVTLSPHRIGDVVAATLVIATMTRGRW